MEQNAPQHQSPAFWTWKILQGSTKGCRYDWCSERLLLSVCGTGLEQAHSGTLLGGQCLCVGKTLVYKVRETVTVFQRVQSRTVNLQQTVCDW